MKEDKQKAPVKPHLEVVLPVFNEVKNIQPILKALDTVKDQLSE